MFHCSLMFSCGVTSSPGGMLVQSMR